MNDKRFKQILEELTDADWQSVVDGMNVLINEDRELLIGVSGSAHSIITGSDYSLTDFTNLKSQVLKESDEILNNYYRLNPLTKAGFNQQAAKLIEEFGFEAFCAHQGKVANRTFFVEGGELVAQTPENPRHRYGVYFEVGQQVPKETLKKHFDLWISRGEAYSAYVGMNVCRYNC